MNRIFIASLYIFVASLALSKTAETYLLIFLWLLVAAHAPFRQAMRTADARTRRLGGLFLILIGWIFVTALLRGMPLRPADRFLHYTPILLVPLFAHYRRHLPRLVMLYAAVCATVVALALLQKTSGMVFPGPFQAYRGERLAGFAGHPIHMAGYYAFGAVMCTTLLFFGNFTTSQRTLAAICAVMLSLGVLLTQSRGFLLVYPLTLVLLALYTRHRQLAWTVTGGFFAAAVYAVFDRALLMRALTLFDLNGYVSNVERIRLWKLATQILTGDWSVFLFGIGFGGWRRRAPEFFRTYAPDMMEAARHKHVHNVFLQWAVETGVIGVLLFCVFMAFIIMALVKIMAKFPRGSFEFAAACGGLFVVICFLLGGLFDYLHDPIILTPLFTLLGFALAGGTPRAAEDRGP